MAHDLVWLFLSGGLGVFGGPGVLGVFGFLIGGGVRSCRGRGVAGKMVVQDGSSWGQVGAKLGSSWGQVGPS